MSDTITPGQRVFGHLHREGGRHVPFRGVLESTYTVDLNGFSLLMGVVKCDDGRTRYPIMAHVTAEPTETGVTADSLALFLALADDAPNWSGEPMIGPGANVETNQADKGRLTELKRKGLVTTYADRGDTFVQFTEAGCELAARYGFQV